MVLDGTPDARKEGTRRWLRYYLDTQVVARLCDDSEPMRVRGRAHNISQGGMAAFLPAEFEEGDTIEVQVMLPYWNRSLKVKATVQYRRMYMYGLEFKDITAEQQWVIERCCRSLALIQ